MQLIEPEFNSISFEFHSIGCFFRIQPFRSHTSCARSRSKPTYSPLSFLYPYGGNSASKPTTNVLSSAVVSSCTSSSAVRQMDSSSPHFFAISSNVPSASMSKSVACTLSRSSVFPFLNPIPYSSEDRRSSSIMNLSPRDSIS